MLDVEDEENSERIYNIDHEAASPCTIHSAVLPKPSLINANINSAITAMLDIVQPKNIHRCLSGYISFWSGYSWKNTNPKKLETFYSLL
jgi:hypothetical protein